MAFPLHKNKCISQAQCVLTIVLMLMRRLFGGYDPTLHSTVVKKGKRKGDEADCKEIPNIRVATIFRGTRKASRVCSHSLCLRNFSTCGGCSVTWRFVGGGGMAGTPDRGADSTPVSCMSQWEQGMGKLYEPE